MQKWWQKKFWDGRVDLISVHHTWLSARIFTVSICICACAQTSSWIFCKSPWMRGMGTPFGWLWETCFLYRTITLPLQRQGFSSAALHKTFCNLEYYSVTSVSFLFHQDSFIISNEYHWVFIINGQHHHTASDVIGHSRLKKILLFVVAITSGGYEHIYFNINYDCH